MSKAANRDQTGTIEAIRASAVFFLPADAITSEEHLAAFLDVSRRTVLSDLFHPADVEGVAYVGVGNRRLCSTNAVLEMLDRQAKPRAKPSGRGGARR